jgi:hypothetical protein
VADLLDQFGSSQSKPIFHAVAESFNSTLEFELLGGDVLRGDRAGLRHSERDFSDPYKFGGSGAPRAQNPLGGGVGRRRLAADPNTSMLVRLEGRSTQPIVGGVRDHDAGRS